MTTVNSIFVPIVSGNWETKETWACGLNDLLIEVKDLKKSSQFNGEMIAERYAWSVTGENDDGVELSIEELVREMDHFDVVVGVGHSYGACTLVKACRKTACKNVVLVLYDYVEHGGEQVGAPAISLSSCVKACLAIYRGAIAPPWSSKLAAPDGLAFRNLQVSAGHCDIVQDIGARMAALSLVSGVLSRAG